VDSVLDRLPDEEPDVTPSGPDEPLMLTFCRWTTVVPEPDPLDPDPEPDVVLVVLVVVVVVPEPDWLVVVLDHWVLSMPLHPASEPDRRTVRSGRAASPAVRRVESRIAVLRGNRSTGDAASRGDAARRSPSMPSAHCARRPR
jgi:hypothetical protein